MKKKFYIQPIVEQLPIITGSIIMASDPKAGPDIDTTPIGGSID